MPPTGREAFRSSGYWESLGGQEGSNAYGAFHAPGRAGELLSGFEAVTRFPRGTVGAPPEPFPLAMFQDLYLARRPA